MSAGNVIQQIKKFLPYVTNVLVSEAYVVMYMPNALSYILMYLVLCVYKDEKKIH